MQILRLSKLLAHIAPRKNLKFPWLLPSIELFSRFQNGQADDFVEMGIVCQHGGSECFCASGY
jgi:hypothetical protein